MAINATGFRSRVDRLLSDLFFNARHCWEEGYIGDANIAAGDEMGNDGGILRDVMVAEATEFLGNYGELFACDLPTPEELADDFLARV